MSPPLLPIDIFNAPHVTAVPTRYKGILVITFGAGLAVGVSGKMSVLTSNRILGSIQGFLSGFTAVVFSYLDMTAR